MNVIQLTNADLQSIFQWRDASEENTRLVRTFDPFLLDGKIEIDNEFSVSFAVFKKQIGYYVSLKYYAERQKLLTLELETLPAGYVKIVDERKTKAYIKAKPLYIKHEEVKQDVIGTFFAVNAYFLNKVTEDRVIPERTVKQHKQGGGNVRNTETPTVKRLNKVYTIKGRYAPSTGATARMRHCEAWEVVGHYRHYKNGKVVYIAPFCKGKNKAKIKGKIFKK